MKTVPYRAGSGMHASGISRMPPAFEKLSSLPQKTEERFQVEMVLRISG
jgi:hypothetical protein